MPPGLRFRTCPALGAWVFAGLLLAADPKASSGAEVPVTASSASRGIPSVLLDDVPLVFAFPSRAVSQPSQILALGATGSGVNSTTGIGLLAAGRFQRFWIFSQPASSLSPVATGRSLQVGWGRSLGGLALGLAARGAPEETEFPIDTGQRSERRTTDAYIVEGSLGVGMGREATFFDLSLDVRRFEDNFRSEATLDSQTVRSSLEVRSDLTPGVRIRLGTGLTTASRLIAVGSWTEERVEVESRLESGAESGRFISKITEPRWAAGVAGVMDSDILGEVVLFANFANTDLFHSRSTSIEESDYFTLGVGLKHELPRGLHLLAGIRTDYVRSSEKSVLSEIDLQSETADWFDRYTWGLRYARGPFELVGAMTPALRLEQLFQSIDARFRF